MTLANLVSKVILKLNINQEHYHCLAAQHMEPLYICSQPCTITFVIGGWVLVKGLCGTMSGHIAFVFGILLLGVHAVQF